MPGTFKPNKGKPRLLDRLSLLLIATALFPYALRRGARWGRVGPLVCCFGVIFVRSDCRRICRYVGVPKFPEHFQNLSVPSGSTAGIGGGSLPYTKYFFAHDGCLIGGDVKGCCYGGLTP